MTELPPGLRSLVSQPARILRVVSSPSEQALITVCSLDQCPRPQRVQPGPGQKHLLHSSEQHMTETKMLSLDSHDSSAADVLPRSLSRLWRLRLVQLPEQLHSGGTVASDHSQSREQGSNFTRERGPGMIPRLNFFTGCRSTSGLCGLTRTRRCHQLCSYAYAQQSYLRSCPVHNFLRAMKVRFIDVAAQSGPG